MGRARRIHLQQATYFVAQERSLPSLFRDDDHYSSFCTQIPGPARRTNVRIHAFCLLPKGFYFAIQIAEQPLSDFMQLLMRNCVSIFNGESGGPTPHPRYRALLIDPRKYLLSLVRYLHWLPELEGIAPVDDYPWNSHQAYLGLSRPLWLSIHEVRRRLMRLNPDVTAAYREWMMQPPTPYEVKRFNRGGYGKALVLDEQLMRKLSAPGSESGSEVSLDQVIEFFAAHYKVSEDELVARSYRRDLRLARALIAWFVTDTEVTATGQKIATLEEVAARLRRAPSTLSQSIQLHKRLEPQLFSKEAWFVHQLGARDAPTPCGDGAPAGVGRNEKLSRSNH